MFHWAIPQKNKTAHKERRTNRKCCVFALMFACFFSFEIPSILSPPFGGGTCHEDASFEATCRVRETEGRKLTSAIDSVFSSYFPPILSARVTCVYALALLFAHTHCSVCARVCVRVFVFDVCVCVYVCVCACVCVCVCVHT